MAAGSCHSVMMQSKFGSTNAHVCVRRQLPAKETVLYYSKQVNLLCPIRLHRGDPNSWQNEKGQEGSTIWKTHSDGDWAGQLCVESWQSWPHSAELANTKKFTRGSSRQLKVWYCSSTCIVSSDSNAQCCDGHDGAQSLTLSHHKIICPWKEWSCNMSLFRIYVVINFVSLSPAFYSSISEPIACVGWSCFSAISRQ